MTNLLDVQKKYKIQKKLLTKRNGMIYNTIVGRGGELVVIDTNVILSGLQSRQGKSFELISQIGSGKFEIALSVPLVLEYEAVLKKRLVPILFSDDDIDNFLDYLCNVTEKIKIFYLWRPYLRDSFDDHILELAVNANAQKLITFNKRDFVEAQKLGISVLTPAEFLNYLGGQI